MKITTKIIGDFLVIMGTATKEGTCKPAFTPEISEANDADLRKRLIAAGYTEEQAGEIIKGVLVDVSVSQKITWTDEELAFRPRKIRWLT